MDATVVVTGASRGVGAAVTRRFAAAGAHVVAADRSADDLASVVESVADADGTVTTRRADVRDEFDVERLMELAAREAGPIDVLVPAARVYHGEVGETPLAEEAYSAFDDHVRTNGRGTFSAIREALPHLPRGARVLVPAGSVARDATDGYGSYAVSTALATAIARQFAVELDRPVGVVDTGEGVPSAATEGDADGLDDVAELFVWAAAEAPAEDLDGGVLDRESHRRASG